MLRGLKERESGVGSRESGLWSRTSGNVALRISIWLLVVLLPLHALVLCESAQLVAESAELQAEAAQTVYLSTVIQHFTFEIRCPKPRLPRLDEIMDPTANRTFVGIKRAQAAKR